jgi:RIO kinase 1
VKIPAGLEPLVKQGIVQSVIRPLTSGKEASLYIVLASDEHVVAKVYKDAKHRSFRHRAGYTEGRRVRNSRQRRAMEKGTRFGKEQMESAWQNAEVDALYRLSAAGLRVPTPHLYTDGVLLMDLILDARGKPAPRLWDVELSADEAVEMHAFLVRQSVDMLCAGMVHGDLSEYNVLVAWDGPMIIDLPQAMDAAGNANARTLFLRDVANFTRFLSRFEPRLATTRYGEEMWRLFERAELFPETPLTGRFKGSDRKADTRAVLDEIETAARDARMRMDADARPKRRGPSRPAASAPPPPPADPFADLDALLSEEPATRRSGGRRR